jgi:hypothetical protein
MSFAKPSLLVLLIDRVNGTQFGQQHALLSRQ